MKRTYAFFFASLAFLPQAADAQNTDCNEFTRDLVVKNFHSNWSDYTRLLQFELQGFPFYFKSVLAELSL